MEPSSRENYKVLVLDMQPIDPPVGGGRIRLLGLYHGLGHRLPATYIGTYDWKGSGYRQHNLSETLEEIDIPLSQKHFDVDQQWKSFAGGQTVIDSLFPLLGRLSKKFVKGVTTAIGKADIVVFSHPWVYPLVRETIMKDRQLIVYDAHNFEGLLKTELLDRDAFGAEIAKQVVCAEYELAHRADLILACSEEDRNSFNNLYNVSLEKMRVISNGVFTTKLTPPTSIQKQSAKEALGLGKQVAIFLGSSYSPNVEAVQFICTRLAPMLRDVTFLLCGGVADAVEVAELRKSAANNIHFVGFLTEDEKLKYLWASDAAINPMFSGSGTNIKMFDFMAVGLPIISTSIGARGINIDSPPAFTISEGKDFGGCITELLSDKSLAIELGKRARQLVETKYSWENISKELGEVLIEAANGKRQKPRDLADGPNEDWQNPDETICIKDKNSAVMAGQSFKNAVERLGVLTTWNAKCGVAENSRYLVSQILAYGTKCLIFANKDGMRSEENGNNALIDVRKVWERGRVDIESIIQICQIEDINNLSIQYHATFFDEETLVSLAAHCKRAGITVTLSLHNVNLMSNASLIQLNVAGCSFIVHSGKDQERLSAMGIERVAHIPLGVLDVYDDLTSDANLSRGMSRRPIIGTFGFVRPHKGLLELIHAIHILRALYPQIYLLGLTALYPSEDSQNYFGQCKKCIRRLKIDDNVQIHTEFHEIEKVIRALHACDAIVLPYHDSSEGASASAAVAIAAKRPVITTQQEIFSDIACASYQVGKAVPSTLAIGIANVLSSPLLLHSLKIKAERYAQENSWIQTAKKYLSCFGGKWSHQLQTNDRYIEGKGS